MYALIAKMHAITASIDGMNAANHERKQAGLALAYPDSAFGQASEELETVSKQLQMI